MKIIVIGVVITIIKVAVHIIVLEKQNLVIVIVKSSALYDE